MHPMTVLLATLLLWLPAAPVAARSAELVDPPAVQVPAGLAGDAVGREVKRALLGRGWSINQARPGQIESTLYLRGHEVRIAITYDADAVHIAYLASANLDYEQADGKRWIHSNYLGWIGFLRGDIANNLPIAAQLG